MTVLHQDIGDTAQESTSQAAQRNDRRPPGESGRALEGFSIHGSGCSPHAAGSNHSRMPLTLSICLYLLPVYCWMPMVALFGEPVALKSTAPEAPS